MSHPTEEDTTVENQPGPGAVIEHFPVQAAEKARPVLPVEEEKIQKWQLSRKAGLRTAFVFLVISLLCFFILLVNRSRLKVANPVHNVQLKELKKEVGKNIQLYEASEDQAYVDELKEVNVLLIQQIRELDLALREYYFGLEAKEDTGTYILFIAVLGFFWSMRSTTLFKPDTPMPQPDLEKGEEQLREKLLGRNAVFVMVVMLSAALLAAYFTEDQKPGAVYLAVAGDQLNKEPENVLHTAEEFAKHWPWLASASTNPVFEANLPVEFDVKTEKNLKWKVQIPMGGAAAPIYWGSTLYVPAANKTKRALYAYDANSGKQKWNTGVKTDKSKGAPTVFEDYVYAGSTSATDGNRVYSIFANGDLIATDMKGKLIWQKDLGIPENDFGHASSLMVKDNILVVQWDHSGENCGIYVYDGLTGEEKYTINRDEFTAIWRTPLIYNDGTVTQLITSAEKLMGHNFETGELLWEMHGIEGEIGSSPMVHEGIMYTLVDDMFGALKPENGKVTEVWKTDDLAIPDIPSPVVKGDYVYTLDSGGVFSCLDIKTGALVYEHEFNMEVYASLILNKEHVYIFGLEGDVFVVETGPEFKQVAENKLHVPIHATPVVYRDSLIIRSDKELFSFAL